MYITHERNTKQRQLISKLRKRRTRNVYIQLELTGNIEYALDEIANTTDTFRINNEMF